jgi:hypothetical protein
VGADAGFAVDSGEFAAATNPGDSSKTIKAKKRSMRISSNNQHQGQG